jgi:tRNA(Leu) C34 or U34 (ribose-2'-O)-methylase TrmL
VLVLAGLQDPGNVGAIVRAAAAFGASGVVAIEGSANPLRREGAARRDGRHVPAARSARADHFRKWWASATELGVRLVAAVPRGGTPLPRIDLRAPTAVVLGGEGAGVPQTTMAAVHETVTIPMQAPAESLNVAIAAALILYEAARQRQESPFPARRGRGGRPDGSCSPTTIRLSARASPRRSIRTRRSRSGCARAPSTTSSARRRCSGRDGRCAPRSSTTAAIDHPVGPAGHGQDDAGAR